MYKIINISILAEKTYTEIYGKILNTKILKLMGRRYTAISDYSEFFIIFIDVVRKIMKPIQAV